MAVSGVILQDSIAGIYRAVRGVCLHLVKAAIRNAMLAITGFLYRGHAAVGIHMTASSAIPQFIYGVFHIRVLMFLVWSLLVVVSMATSAVWLVGAEPPGNQFTIRQVA